MPHHREEVLLGTCALRFVTKRIPDIFSAIEVAKYFLIVPLPQSLLVFF
jgi:hypothetical protein